MAEREKITLDVLARTYKEQDSIQYASEPVFRVPMAQFIKRVRRIERAYPDADADAYQAEIADAVSDATHEMMNAAARKYRTPLTGFLTKRLGAEDTAAQADDIVQEAFMRATKHFHGYDFTKKFSTWMYTITHNLLKNEYRNRERSPFTTFSTLTQNWKEDSRPLEWEDTSQMPDKLYEKRDLRKGIAEVIEELPRHHGQTLQLRVLQDMTYEEMAEELGVSKGTVKSRINRARRLAKDPLQERIA